MDPSHFGEIGTCISRPIDRWPTSGHTVRFVAAKILDVERLVLTGVERTNALIDLGPELT
jgi:hypothetical protein